MKRSYLGHPVLFQELSEMRIRVKTFYDLKDGMPSNGEIEIETGPVTIRGMLVELSKRYGTIWANKILDPETREIRPQCLILVNGRHCRHLRDGLGTELNEGDTLQIFPLVAGG
ncbi:MAG: MoaD/ThiS family protein [Deltaproteobacteria bacterium]